MSTTTAGGPGLRAAVAAGCAAFAASMGIGRFVYTPILPVMRAEVGLTTADAGLLASANFAGYLVGALACALPVVRRYRSPAILGGLALQVLTLAAVPWATGVVGWAAVRCLSGAAGAFVFVLAADVTLTLVRQHRRDDLAGWVFGGVGIGIVASGVVTPVAAALGGWAATWYAAAAVAAVFALPAARLAALPADPAGGAGSDDPPRTGPAVALGVAYVLEATGYVITGTFLVDVATDIGPAWVAASTWTIAGLAGVPSCVLWARLAARRGLGPALVAALAVQAVGLALPALVPAPWAVVVSAVVFGGTFIAIVMLTLALARVLTGRRAGPAVAVFSTLYGIGQAIGPSLVPLVGDDARPALVLAGALVLVATLCALPAAGADR